MVSLLAFVLSVVSIACLARLVWISIMVAVELLVKRELARAGAAVLITLWKPPYYRGRCMN